MRNTEAQRYARWSLAAAASLAAAVAGVYLRNAYIARQVAKKAPPAVPATVEQRSSEFAFSKVEGQRTIYTVRASRATEFKEGSRNLLEDVDISVYGKKGERADKLRTRACDFISDTGKINCAGDVEISLQASPTPHASANAIQVKTSAVTFDRDSGRAHTEMPVTFRWPGGAGRAVGASYDSESGTLRLEHAVELNLASSPAAPAGGVQTTPGKELRLTGSGMSFQRETQKVEMDGDVRGQQAGHELACEKLLLELNADFRARRVIAAGRPEVREADPRGPIALTADEIASNLRPDGSVESIVATGKVHGERTSPAGEDKIDAGRVQLDLATRQNLPRLLTASDGVALNSVRPAASAETRRVETDALEIHFSAYSPGQTLVQSINSLAPAQVELRSNTMQNGKPAAQIVRMAGKEMNLQFAGESQLQQLVSTGGVEVTRKVGDAPEERTTSRDLAATFNDAGEWATIDQSGDVRYHDGQRTGQAVRAHADRDTNALELEGSVILADAATRTTAQSASFSQGPNILRASGHVLSTELRGQGGGISNFAPEPAHIAAERLEADTARGHAVYSGNGRLWQGQSVIEADTIELDSLTHTLVAKGHVRGVFPQAAWSPNPEPAAPRNASGPGLQPATMSSSAEREVKGNPFDSEGKQIGLANKGQASGRAATRLSPKATRPRTQLGHARGDTLTYWEEEGRARIEQNAQVDTEQGSIQADKIDLYFSDSGAANGSKQVSRAVALGGVSVRQEDRHGTSERAEYTAAEGKFVLSEGKPTLYSSTGDSTTGRQLTFYFADDRIVVDSAEGSKTVTLHQVEK